MHTCTRFLPLLGALALNTCGGGSNSHSPVSPTAMDLVTSSSQSGEGPLGVCDVTFSNATLTPTLDVITIPSGDPFFVAATKCIRVFGLMFFASNVGPEIADSKLTHAASIAAQYLDNNEDGTVDDLSVNNFLERQNASIVVVNTLGTDEDIFLQRVGDLIEYNASQLGVKEMPPDAGKGLGGAQFDASLEEILHLIQDNGYMYAHPDLSQEGTTKLTTAMDVARGGHFTSVPAQYPDGAWFTYYDTHCDYLCQATEYFYWLLTSVLDGQSHRCSILEPEWRLCTRTQVQTGDTLGYDLVTNPAYNLPTVLPDGQYR